MSEIDSTTPGASVTNIFQVKDHWAETVTVDSWALKSGERLVMVRIFDEDGDLRGSVELKQADLLALRFAIDNYVAEGGGFVSPKE